MLKDLSRRVRNAMAFGTTTAPVQAPGNVAQVQVRLSALETTTLKLVEQRGFASGLPVGTPVVAMFHAGDRSNGVVMGSVAPGSRPALAGAEDAAMYGHGFSIVITADGVHITAPNVLISGNLHVNGEVFSKAGAGPAANPSSSGAVSLSQHKHGAGPAPTPGT